jgi:hypothetical protein
MGVAVVIAANGLPVTISTNGYGLPCSLALTGLAITVVANGRPIVDAGSLIGSIPGGSGTDPSLDFSDPNNSQYIPGVL